jgi:hypothetical protein
MCALSIQSLMGLGEKSASLLDNTESLLKDVNFKLAHDAIIVPNLITMAWGPV